MDTMIGVPTIGRLDGIDCLDRYINKAKFDVLFIGHEPAYAHLIRQAPHLKPGIIDTESSQYTIWIRETVKYTVEDVKKYADNGKLLSDRQFTFVNQTSGQKCVVDCKLDEFGVRFKDSSLHSSKM